MPLTISPTVLRASFAFLAFCSFAFTQSRDDRWRQDLQSLQKQVIARHPNPFTKITWKDFIASVRSIDEAIPHQTDAQLAAGFARLVASIGDAHTSISLTQTAARASFLPIRVRWFSDGLFVTHAAEAHAITAPFLSHPKFPLYRRNTAQSYWFAYLEESRTVYFQFNQCRDTPTLPFAQFARELVAFVESNPVDRLIFDFRNNNGGSSSVIRPLFEGSGASLAAGRISFPKGTFLLIGRQTFSSASLDTAGIKSQA